MKYAKCGTCKFWVEQGTKRCPNCGRFYPAREEMPIKAYAAKWFLLTAITGFLFSLFISFLLLLKDDSIGLDILGLILFITLFFAIAGSIAGTVLGIIRKVCLNIYLNVSKVKLFRLPYLMNDEQKIVQRQNELSRKEERILESMRVWEQSLTYSEQPTETFELAKKTLQNALDAIRQQRDEYKLKTWEIALIRWYNPVKPLAMNIHSNRHPEQEHYDSYLQELEDIRSTGRALLHQIHELELSAL